MTIKKIAEMAGVSISTVSKIINNKDQGIRPDTRARVLDLVKKYNYNPYSRGNQPQLNSFTIGVLIPSLTKPLLFSGILKEASENDYSVLIMESHNDPDQEQRSILKLCSQHPDAVIWEPVNQKSLSEGKHFEKENIPFWFINAPYAQTSLCIDYAQLGEYAVTYLVSKSHTDIACISGKSPDAKAFQEGYVQGLISSGIPYNDQLSFTSINQTLLYKLSEKKISCIICFSYQDALKLQKNLSPLYDTGMPFPILSLTDQEPVYRKELSPAIICIPYLDFGRHICKQIIGHLENNSAILPFAASPTVSNSNRISPPFESHKKKLTIVGSINLDHYLKVSSLPVSGNAVISSPLSKHPGGKAINQAVGASKLGAEVNIIGAIGQDPYNEVITSTLSRHSVCLEGLKHYPQVDTGKAFIFIQSDGNSLISILPGANNLLSDEDILSCENLFESTDYCLLQTEVPQNVLATAAKLSRKHHAVTILKPSACTHLNKTLLKYTDILVPNQQELSILAPEGTPSEQAAHFLKQGVKTVIVTLGESGCLLKTKEIEKTFPAAFFNPLDNTGAGDAFISALAVYLQLDYSLESSIQIATYAAGFCISREGVVPSLVDKETLELYINKTNPGLLG